MSMNFFSEAQLDFNIHKYRKIGYDEGYAAAIADAEKAVRQAMKDQDEYGLASGTWILTELKALLSRGSR